MRLVDMAVKKVSYLTKMETKKNQPCRSKSVGEVITKCAVIPYWFLTDYFVITSESHCSNGNEFMLKQLVRSQKRRSLSKPTRKKRKYHGKRKPCRNHFRLRTWVIEASSRGRVTALILILMYLFDRSTLLINVRTMIPTELGGPCYTKVNSFLVASPLEVFD